MESLFDTTDPKAPRRYTQVALEQSIDVAGTGAGGLTYAVPPELFNLQKGERVIVPLGRGDHEVSGYVLDALTDRPNLTDGRGTRLKLIRGRDPEQIHLTADLIDLARWMAGYYCTPIGMVLANMIPGAVKRGAGRVTLALISFPDATPLPAKGKMRLSQRQRQVLTTACELIQQGEPFIDMRRLANLAGSKTTAPIKQLIAKGLLVTRAAPSVESDYDREIRDYTEPLQSLTLTAAQQKALDAINAELHQFNVFLLHGVTGSGKTEVYLRTIERILATSPDENGQIRSAIMLVPELALTPQTSARLRARFGDSVAVLHAGLTPAQRHDHWRRIREGRARVVVGARSAVFAPVPRLGLIVVDEEQEHSYKQDQLPRYHARDVAIKRAQLAGVPIILGSATPSLESYYNAKSRSNYRLLQLPERVGGSRLPHIQIIDLVAERKARKGIHLLSQRLEHLLEHALRQRAQAILLLNRRGYANYIACPNHNCAWTMNCQYCDAMMVYHKDHDLPDGGLVRCHHCQTEQLLKRFCPQCGKKVTVFGLGTQRVEEELQKKLPKARIMRLDSDVLRTEKNYREVLGKFRSGEIDILVGTQIIAKGLDFPNVTVVGVISADTSLHMPDFRASERTFQMIAQVAGRAGRSASVQSQAATVVVQTFNPNDTAIQLACKHDYEGFAAQELKTRAAVGLPPVARMARLVIRDQDVEKCTQRAAELGRQLHEQQKRLQHPVKIRGPVPCPIARIASFFRRQIELLSPPPPQEAAAALQELLTHLRNQHLLRSDARTAVDVDPVDLL